MHSKIIQLVSEPIKKSEYISESDFYEDFVGEIADYVDECDEECRRDNCEYLFTDKCGFFLSKSENGEMTVEITDKNKHFLGSYETFNDIVARLHPSFEEFTGDSVDNRGLSSLMFRLMESYDDKYGIYVSSEYSNYETLDSFMRRHKTGDKFYVGGVIDYHY